MIGNRGFTLVELVIVIAITGVLAASVTIFLVPAVEGYFAASRRAELTDMADTALRRMSQDVRRAVPNSVETFNAGTCFRLVPTAWGGRYRMGADIANDLGVVKSAPLEVGGTVFDVLAISPAPPAAMPAAGDFVVIDNQNGGDVYTGSNRAVIVPNASAPRATDGMTRITTAAPALPAGYYEGRFVVVPAEQQVVYYSCAGGALFRNAVTFAVAGGGAAPCGGGVALATADGVACTFAYEAATTATQQNGLVWLNVTLTRSGETVSLTHSTNVPNVP